MKLFILAVSLLLFKTASASLVYVPPQMNPATARVLVVIHGCLQSAESMALGTGFNQAADRHNLVVIYPQVPERSNPVDCWGWYQPANQRPDSGQLQAIVTEIQKVRARLKLKKTSNFVTGISSGGGTTAGLLACYPELFRGGAIHSGPSYAQASSLVEAEKVLKEGPGRTAVTAPCRPTAFKGGLLVLHGEADPVVHPAHASRILQDFSEAKGRLLMIPDLGHAWSGSTGNLRHAELLGPGGKIPTLLPFFSEEGPSATKRILDFFLFQI